MRRGPTAAEGAADRARGSHRRRSREGFLAGDPRFDSGEPTLRPQTLFLPRVLFPVELAKSLTFANNQLHVYLYIGQEDS